MNCRAFEAWLDAGRPAAERDAADEHARTCPGCAAAVAAEDGWVAVMRTALAPPRAGFTDQVLLRVARLPSDEPRPAVDPDLIVPWWAQILREPAAILGLLLGGLWTATMSTLWPWLRNELPHLAAAWPAWGIPQLVPQWSLPFLVVVAAVLLLGSTWGLYRLATAAFSRLSGFAH